MEKRKTNKEIMKKLYKQKEQVKAMKKLLANYQNPNSYLEECPLCDVIPEKYRCKKCVWVRETGASCIVASRYKILLLGILRNAKINSRNEELRQWAAMRIEQLQEWIEKYDIYGKDHKNDMDKR